MNNESNSNNHNATTISRSGYQRVIGVDVAKDKLDIHDSAGKLSPCIDNNPSEIVKKLINRIKQDASTLVVCESSGSYHLDLMDAMHEHSLNIAVVNARQVRDLAKAHGRLEKTDPIDARMICRFGQDVEVHLTPPRTEDEKRHLALVNRRVTLLKMRTQEKLRLSHCRDQEVIRFIKQSLRNIENQLQRVDTRLSEILKELAKKDARVDILLSHKGVGVVTTSVLMTQLPELGALNRREIAKLVGISPMADQSGLKDGKRRIRGGRQAVRTALYMAANSARQHDPAMKAFYDRLTKHGKPFKVVMVACMRKMLSTLNQMVRNGESYDSSLYAAMV